MERFWNKVNKTDDCWEWKGCKFQSGYGRFRCNNKMWRAHRFAYLLVKGDLPEGLVLDHLCRNKECVNPDHLEAVTQKENCNRGNVGSNHRDKTHCKRGHEYNEENTYVCPRGSRNCRKCQKINKDNRGRLS